MKSRNSSGGLAGAQGLACGCSAPRSRCGGYEVELGAMQVPGQVVATGQNATILIASSQNQSFYFREGIAFGAAWTASWFYNTAVPAQWHRDFEVAAQSQEQATIGTAGNMGDSLLQQALRIAPDRNRAAFVYGFDIGIQLLFGQQTLVRGSTGRVFEKSALRAQGRVVANTVFNQVRPAILPAT